MSTRPVADLDRVLERDPAYRAALRELDQQEDIERELIAARLQQADAGNRDSAPK
jgi:hypothetical protein